MGKKNWLKAAVASVALLAAAPAIAQISVEIGGIETNVPILIIADELDYDRETRVVTATGNVEISQGQQILKADKVTYNQVTRRVTAVGNVSITQPDGNVIFADRAELTDDLREGVIDQFGLLFPDRTRVAASWAERTGGQRTIMGPTVFSPCYLCEDDPTRPPLWQLRARRVEHDQLTHDIIYRDARMEIYGVPVFYTPYFRHPDPTVKRRSGFLPPILGSDSQLGATAVIPYFWVLGPDKDVTLTPFVTTAERAAMFAEYRQRLKNGQFTASGSYTYVTKRSNTTGARIGGNESRGHIFSRGRFNIDRNWRWGFDAEYASDDTYLRRYNLTSTDTLISTPYAEGFFDRNYYHVRGYYFQGLRRQDDAGQTPIIFPLAEMEMYGEPVRNWGRWRLQANLLNLARTEGTDSRRLSFTAGWRLPLTHPLGFKLTIDAQVAGDAYWVQQVARPGKSSFDGTDGRIYPQLRVDWRYPFVRELGNVRHIVEPRAAIIVAPTGLNSSRIPNEDSIDLEFDDSNLFALNRFPGRDRVDDGTRVVYGLKNLFVGNRGGRTELFVGHSYRLSGGDPFRPDSGLARRSSDVVGRVRVEPSSLFSMLYRFRIDPRDLKIRRTEVQASMGAPILRLTLNYAFFDESGGAREFRDREEISAGFSSQITENWQVFGRGRWDISEDGGILNFAVGGQYRNECCEVRMVVSRSFTRDRDLRSSTNFVLQVIFKHLGQIGTG